MDCSGVVQVHRVRHTVGSNTPYNYLIQLYTFRVQGLAFFLPWFPDYLPFQYFLVHSPGSVGYPHSW